MDETVEPEQVEEAEEVQALDDEGDTYSSAFKSVLISLASLVLLFLLLKTWLWWRSRRMRRNWGFKNLPTQPLVVGFFHPYCNAGGGGERVLWHSIQALQRRYSFVRCVVYTGDRDAKARDILNKVQERFGILLLRDVQFVYLRLRGWVEPRCWPRFTLLGQSIGSIFLGLEALVKFVPNIYIDTMGYAFTLPLFRWLGGCKTASYVHYPIVSRDMLNQVSSQSSSYNNAVWISQSRTLSKTKLCYYKLFAKLYGFVGRRNDVVMVNSSWTHGHIQEIWKPYKIFIVYPPCDTKTFQRLPLKRSNRNIRIVSLGQFRPEKDHRMQLEVLAATLQRLRVRRVSGNVTLVLIGSCRNFEDHERVDALKSYASQLGVLDNVQFRTNIGFEELQQELGQATIALHTMQNEHFGISLVECMAAGCVMVAHKSGGPLMDIITDWQSHSTGYLALDKNSFTSCLLEVLSLSEQERIHIVAAARDSVQAKFSVDVFEASFLRATEQLFG